MDPTLELRRQLNALGLPAELFKQGFRERLQELKERQLAQLDPEYAAFLKEAYEADWQGDLNYLGLRPYDPYVLRESVLRIERKQERAKKREKRRQDKLAALTPTKGT